MSFRRVIPRDFFNESKLLKCLGKFEIHRENVDLKIDIPYQVEYDGKPFQVEQDDSDGSLRVVNYRVYILNEPLDLFIPYNSKDDWPLYARVKDTEWKILGEDGSLQSCIIHGLKRTK